MQQNNNHWLRRMREKHRRICEINKLVQPENHQTHLKKAPKTGITNNNVIPIEHRRTFGGSKKLASIDELEADVWELRKQFILQIAKRHNGKVRLQEVAAECNVNIRIAAEWLIRLSTEGMLSLVAGQRYTMTYLVKDVGGAPK